MSSDLFDDLAELAVDGSERETKGYRDTDDERGVLDEGFTSWPRYVNNFRPDLLEIADE